MSEISEQHGEVNGLEFVWLEAGDADAPLALCLHGFPDTAHGWRRLLPRLADAGFHAVAPFARGYAPTAVPADGMSALASWVADAVAFHERFGHDAPGVIIGHDWGALTTYGAATFAPERWRRVVAMSVPPTEVMASRLLEFDQVRAFWYQYVFQSPGAEAIVANHDLLFIEKLWREWSPAFDPTDEMAHVKGALRGPSNLTAALSTYRSMYDFTLQPEAYAAQLASILGPHTQPTLYLHGLDDGCVSGEVIEPTRAALPGGSIAESIADAGHFLQYEQPDAVNDRILAFVTA
jgi:pimeloyl-ACP methyl ester carboxylesterase